MEVQDAFSTDFFLKKSRQETKGTGSGVEIIENKPYEGGPGGSGQYTYKVYHVGSHLPGWFCAILPESALKVEEEAWNAYPYTRTRYTTPFVERFLLDVETRYFNDDGRQDNVFGLSASELKDRVVDVIDIVNDPIGSGDYNKDEDPTLYVSSKTGRGPLGSNWVKDCLAQNKPLMTAYKVCRVEFRYWGMQTKIERFIHDIALRKTMVRAHRQAWAWQDEWWGLTLEDIRRLEKEAQEQLNKKVARHHHKDMPEWDNMEMAELLGKDISPSGSNQSLPTVDEEEILENGCGKQHLKPDPSMPEDLDFVSLHSTSAPRLRLHIGDSRKSSLARRRLSMAMDEEFYDAFETLSLAGFGHSDSRDFYSALENIRGSPQAITSGMEDSPCTSRRSNTSSEDTLTVGPPPLPQCPTKVLFLVFHGGSALDSAHIINDRDLKGAKINDVNTLRTTLESVFRAAYPGLLNRVILKMVYCPPICKEAVSSLVSICPYGRSHAAGLNANDHHHFFSRSSTGSSMGAGPSCCENLPISLLPIFASSCPSYGKAITVAGRSANIAYNEFLASPEGQGFDGEVCVIGEMLGGLIAYDVLVNCAQTASTATSDYGGSPQHPDEVGTDSRHQSGASPRSVSSKDSSGINHQDSFSSLSPVDIPRLSVESFEDDFDPIPKDESYSTLKDIDSEQVLGDETSHYSVCQEPPTTLTPAQNDASSSSNHLQFQASRLFVLGCPLGLMLSYRRLLGCFNDDGGNLPIPVLGQVYNLFYVTDPCAARLEPLLCPSFSGMTPVALPRYAHYPHGDGSTHHICDSDLFTQYQLHSAQGPTDSNNHPRIPISNTCTGAGPSAQQNPFWHGLAALAAAGWWGGCTQRVDYAVFIPDGVARFPRITLPHLLHGSFFESTDLAAFIARQFVAGAPATSATTNPERSGSVLSVNTTPSPRSPQPSASGNIDRSLGQIPPPQPVDPVLLNVSDDRLVKKVRQNQPVEKWCRRSTSIKVRRKGIGAATPNHRANDVIVPEDDVVTRNPPGSTEQDCRKTTEICLPARFRYGHLDVVSLAGERVDVYIRLEAADQPLEPTTYSGGFHGTTSVAATNWTYIGTGVTDKSGRLDFPVRFRSSDERGASKSPSPASSASLSTMSSSSSRNDQQRPNSATTTSFPINPLPAGIYPIRMIVRGDASTLSMSLTIVPRNTEAVVFSIDGALTASMSVSGRDPKIRRGAVDLVRFWADAGYLIVYISARPDMQARRMTAWLAGHGFPPGGMFFADGLSKEPMRQKAATLKRLTARTSLVIHAAYGSSKDLTVYQSANIPAGSIFIITAHSSVGRFTRNRRSTPSPATNSELMGELDTASMKSMTHDPTSFTHTAIRHDEGYAAHVAALKAETLPIGRPATGNGRLVLQRNRQFYDRQHSLGRQDSPGPNVVLSATSGSLSATIDGYAAYSAETEDIIQSSSRLSYPMALRSHSHNPKAE